MTAGYIVLPSAFHSALEKDFYMAKSNQVVQLFGTVRKFGPEVELTSG
jgi:hypothetical protein